MQEINMSRTLTYVAGGFLLCWILMWALVFWKRFSPGTAPRILHIAIVFLFFLSSAVNPFIDATRNRVFREEFLKLLPKWKVRSRTSEAEKEAVAWKHGKQQREILETRLLNSRLGFSTAKSIANVPLSVTNPNCCKLCYCTAILAVILSFLAT